MRKRIAVLVAQIDETTQKRFLHGFTKQAYAKDYDICIFTMLQKYQETHLRGLGDANIFTLINYELFDGIVVLLDTIQTPNFSDDLQSRIKENFDGPVLVVDTESEYFETVMMDHYTPVKKLVDHMLEAHGYQKIAFLGGKEGHPHSVQRYEAFLNSMNEHDCVVNYDWVYHGNYWYDSSEKFVDQLLKDKQNLPEAVVCANDIMAIGAAARFQEYGIRIPEDIAIIGYDSVEDGRTSPVPLTSSEIPAESCGEYSLLWLHSKITNEELNGFETEVSLLFGGSCGCEYKVEMVPKSLRNEWRTHQSARNTFSDFNHMLEDLLAQTNYDGFLDAVSKYVYQIRPFKSFDICLNSSFNRADTNIGGNARRKGYEEKMSRVLICDEKSEIITYEDEFDTKILSPRLVENRSYPTTFIFTPVFFDDRCFGYTVLNYGNENRVYTNAYRMWMRDLMQGMESFYRQQYLQMLVNRIRADQIRDSLTGLYNYEGFLRCVHGILAQKFVKLNILTIDLKGIRSKNEVYGREYGEKAIVAMSRILNDSLLDGDISARLSNDEFLVALKDDRAGNRGDAVINSITAHLNEYNASVEPDYRLEFHFASAMGNPMGTGDVELLVNQAISIKNHKKDMLRNNSSAHADNLSDEIRINQQVNQVLNHNQLTYHYQPIVEAKTGNIYAYEALMRCDIEGLSPFKIIKSANYLNRLYDIEKYTLLNVTKDVTENLEAFGDAKVFINSLPNHQISGEDDRIFSERARMNSGRFVIEFTEESELDDEQLELLKKKHEFLGNGIAVDDFGAGYSNVNNLLRYKPKYVKIDRELITDIQNSPQKKHFVNTIIEYAHNNDILALAEGVEVKEELKEVIDMGVDLIQGYYTARPQRKPLKEISEKVKHEIEFFNVMKEQW